MLHAGREGLVVREFDVTSRQQDTPLVSELHPRLTARLDLRCEPFDPDRHSLCHEVKAITYHELKVVPTADGWLAEVIVDI